MDQTRIYYLAGQYLEKKLNEAERLEFDRLLQDPTYEEALHAAFEAQAGELDLAVEQDKSLLPILHASLASDRPPLRVAFRYRKAWAAAAAVLVLITATYFFWSFRKTTRHSTQTATTTDIAPGRQGAILTLADGSQIMLDSLKNGVVAQQNGARLVLNNAQLAYDPAEGNSMEVAYNTASTPRGRQFRIMLPDGTVAWLNAASAITFPTTFKGKERAIKIKGEVYLEVAKDPHMPFRVNINDQAVVEVLGTSFNVNAYTEEASINTTLLEGSVKVIALKGNAQVKLKPGQQAQLSPGTGTTIPVVNDADIDKVMAWKNGAFNFEGSTMEEVMRQLERWYDIRVQFKGDGSKRMFGGKMGRNVSLAHVLEMFKIMGVKYEWDGATLVIY